MTINSLKNVIKEADEAADKGKVRNVPYLSPLPYTDPRAKERKWRHVFEVVVERNNPFHRLKMRDEWLKDAIRQARENLASKQIL